jgi:hypothetical protein
LPTADRSPPVSGRVVLLAALASAGATLLLLRLGSGHTPASRRFAKLPEFDVWIWIYAAYVGTAAALGIASFPAFWRLARTTGRHAAVLAVVAWPVLGVLALLFGPHALGKSIPLWLGSWRSNTANAIGGVFITPAFAGLLLIQARLSALARETFSGANEDEAGGLIVELSWLRTAMLRFLTNFAALLTIGLFGLGALRLAELAFDPRADVPILRLLTFGGLTTALIALIFIPAYVTWQERVSELRDALHPVPNDGRPAHEWFQARDDFDTLLTAKASAGQVLATTFSVLAPLTATVISALLAGSH